MTTISDTSILHWLPFDENGAEVLKLAFTDADNSNWNSTQLNNSTAMGDSKGVHYSLMTSPAQLGLATGLLFSLLLNSRIWTIKANREVLGHKLFFGEPKPYQWILHLTPYTSFTFASTKTFILHYLYLLPFLAVIFLLPLLLFLAIILLPFAIYRFLVFVYLKKSAKKEERKKLLSGADAVWKFNESYKCYSVINALILLEGYPDINRLRNIIRERLGKFPKLRMRHSFTLGYATWYDDHNLDLGSLVRWMPGTWGDNEFSEEPSSKNNSSFRKNVHASKRENIGNDCGSRSLKNKKKSTVNPNESNNCKKWNRKVLSEIIEQFCNQPLPEDHSVSWEACIGQAMPWDELYHSELEESTMNKYNHDNEKSEEVTVFPILFRIHHSVGDGASLLQLLMSTLIDDESVIETLNYNKCSEESVKRTSLLRPLTLNIPSNNFKANDRETGNILEKTDKISSSQSNTNFENHAESQEKELVEHIQKSMITTKINGHSISHRKYVAAEELQFDKVKESSFLYGRPLTGKKLILWDSDSVTVEDIKKIRAATGVKFTEILHSAISAALSSYWEARKDGTLNDQHQETNYLNKKRQTSCDLQSEEDWDELETVPEEGEAESFQPKEKGIMNLPEAANENPPSSVKIVVPAMLGSLFQKPKIVGINGCTELENLFSVAVMTLPIGKSGGCPMQRLSKVSDASSCMMPLRRDSVIDCKSKFNFSLMNRKKSLCEISNPLKSNYKTYEHLNNEENSSHLCEDDDSDYVENNDHKTSEIQKEYEKSTVKVSTYEKEIITYYYTAEQHKTFIDSNHQDPFITQNATQDLNIKKSNSIKLIVTDKAPYNCPTTIFFTDNNQCNKYSQPCKEEISKLVHPIQDVSNKPFSADLSIKNVVSNEESITKTMKRFESPVRITVESKTIAKKPLLQNISDFDVRSQKTKTSPSHLSLQLPSSPTIQHLITRWLALGVIATIIPSFVAAPLMAVASRGVAVVMSNLPGPPTRLHSILGGYSMKEIVFWAPHRGYTGLGITVISYDGKLHFGLMADKAVIPTRREAEFILNGVLDELHSLGAAVSSAH